VEILDSILTLYAWFIALLLMVILCLIARFYQLKSGQRSYFQLFMVPALLFLGAGIRYAIGANVWIGDQAADALLFLAGILTVWLGGYLLRIMLGGRR
jgi:hypothetical protein